MRTQIIGKATPQKEQQAQRVQEFMNYQLMHVMEDFDPDLDQMLFYLPLSGSAFKKIYFDSTLDRAVSKFIPSDDLVVPYTSTDLATAEANLTAVMLEIKGEYNFPNNLDQVRKSIVDFQGGDKLKVIPNKARAKEIAMSQANVEVQNWIMKNQAYKATTGQIEQMIVERTKELLNDPTLITNKDRLYAAEEGDQQLNNENIQSTPDDALLPG